MNPPCTIPPRPETNIDDNNAMDNHDGQPLENGDATPIVTLRQDTPTENTNNNDTPIGMTTPPVQTQFNDSNKDTETPQIFRQALENAPNPSSFLQTPQQEAVDNLSWDIDNDTDEDVNMYSIIKESFQETLQDFSLFTHFDVLCLHHIVSFDFQKCIDGSTKDELEDKDFKQFLLKLFIFKTILEMSQQEFILMIFP